MSSNTEKSSGSEMTFFEHIDALRPHLIRGAAAIIVLTIAAFLGKGFIIDNILFGPQMPDFPTNTLLCKLGHILGAQESLCINQIKFNMVNTTMAGQFNLHLKISIITAVILAVPYILWELWRFIRPALTKRERRGSRMFVLYVSMCFFIGLVFGYFIIAPLTINFLTGYQASSLITNMIDVNSYLATVINVSLACAAVFQLPLLVYFLTRMGVLTPDFMKKYRKHSIFVLAVLAAVITPPDIFSMILVLLPLYGLYEFSISLSARVVRQHNL